MKRKPVRKPEIVVGSVVKLKSGGPAMTVKRISEPRVGEYEMRCVWFDNYAPTIMRDADFVRETLLALGAKS